MVLRVAIMCADPSPLAGRLLIARGEGGMDTVIRNTLSSLRRTPPQTPTTLLNASLSTGDLAARPEGQQLRDKIILDFLADDVDTEYERIAALGVAWTMLPTTQAGCNVGPGGFMEAMRGRSEEQPSRQSVPLPAQSRGVDR
jgi:hypothetical protein